MAEASPLKLIAVFVVIVVVGVAGAAAFAVTGSGSGTPDGANIAGQSPAQFQPDAVYGDYDPETGELSVDADTDESKRILVDTQHSNQFSRTKLQPIVEAMFESGHTIQFGHESTGGSDTGDGYGQTLKQYDGVIIIQPTSDFTPNETKAIRAYTEAGGHVVVLGEPTQIQGGTGLFSVPSPVSFGATNLTRAYGVQVGAEMLYNVDDDANDNNFKSLYASPSGDGMLTEGVETVTFDRAGYVAVNENHEEADDVEVLYTAAEGTKTLDTRREREFPMAVRNGNMVFVVDSTFIEDSEVYDADNEVLVGNMLEFLVSGNLSEDFPPEELTTGPTEPSTPPEPPEPPTPTPTTPTPATPTPPPG